MAEDLFPAIRELHAKVKAVDQFVLINTILKRPEYQKFITNYNTRVQLFELNEDSEGIKLAANRSGYADETLRLAAAGEGGYTQAKRGRDRVDLIATGDYYESHSVEIVSLKADYFNMLSDDVKDGVSLSEEWGPILGLNDKGMELLGEFILEAFIPLFLEVIE